MKRFYFNFASLLVLGACGNNDSEKRKIIKSQKVNQTKSLTIQRKIKIRKQG